MVFKAKMAKWHSVFIAKNLLKNNNVLLIRKKHSTRAGVLMENNLMKAIKTRLEQNKNKVITIKGKPTGGMSSAIPLPSITKHRGKRKKKKYRRSI